MRNAVAEAILAGEGRLVTGRDEARTWRHRRGHGSPATRAVAGTLATARLGVSESLAQPDLGVNKNFFRLTLRVQVGWDPIRLGSLGQTRLKSGGQYLSISVMGVLFAGVESPKPAANGQPAGQGKADELVHGILVVGVTAGGGCWLGFSIVAIDVSIAKVFVRAECLAARTSRFRTNPSVVQKTTLWHQAEMQVAWAAPLHLATAYWLPDQQPLLPVLAERRR